MSHWTNNHGLEIVYIQPGKPAQNELTERFNRSCRQAVLKPYLFDSIACVQKKTDEWLAHYNNERPHKSLGYLAPRQYMKA